MKVKVEEGRNGDAKSGQHKFTIIWVCVFSDPE